MVRTLGALVGCSEKAEHLARSFEQRMDSIRAETRTRKSRPRQFRGMG
jgi:iron complex transport system substrate-binding protein